MEKVSGHSGAGAARSASEAEAFDRLVGWLQQRQVRKGHGTIQDAGVGTGLVSLSTMIVEEDADTGPYGLHTKAAQPEPEPEPEPKLDTVRSVPARPTLSLQLEQPEATATIGELKFYVMSFNMECGDPTKWSCDFLPTDCDVYVIGLQEAGGENIETVPPSPRPPPDAKKKLSTKEALYNMMETHLDKHSDCVRLRHTDRIVSDGVLEAPEVAGRGDQSMKKPKFTSLGIFVRSTLTSRVSLQASCAHSFGKTEGSKGAVAVVLRCDGTTIAFVNCHLTAGKGKAGSSKKRVGQYGTVVETLGRKLGLSQKGKLGKQKSTKNDQQIFQSSFELHTLFSHVVWMGDMNWKLEKTVRPEDAINKIRAGELQELEQYDTLTQALSTRDSAFALYTEPTKCFGGPGHFYPTYKKKPYRIAVLDYSNPDWVDGEYRILYKEPFYKGGKEKPRVPAWCDRILYRSANRLQGALVPEQIDLGGALGVTDNYQAINDTMLCSDHSPVFATFLMTTEAGAWASLGAASACSTAVEGSPCVVQLRRVKICDKTGRWSIGLDGAWTDDKADATWELDQRLMHVLAPSPFEVPGALSEVHSVTLAEVNGAEAAAAGCHSWVTQALVPQQHSGDLEELQQHTVCVKIMLQQNSTSDQEEWGECAVRAAVHPRDALSDPLGQDLVGESSQDKLTSYLEPLVSNGVPVLWQPPKVVFGSGGGSEQKSKRGGDEVREPTEPLYLQFELSLSAK